LDFTRPSQASDNIVLYGFFINTGHMALSSISTVELDYTYLQYSQAYLIFQDRSHC